jgi:hypothetical protein
MLAQNKPFSYKVGMDKGIVKEHSMNNFFLSRVRQTITPINGSCTTMCVLSLCSTLQLEQQSESR